MKKLLKLIHSHLINNLWPAWLGAEKRLMHVECELRAIAERLNAKKLTLDGAAVVDPNKPSTWRTASERLAAIECVLERIESRLNVLNATTIHYFPHYEPPPLTRPWEPWGTTTCGGSAAGQDVSVGQGPVIHVSGGKCECAACHASNDLPSGYQGVQ